jgi:uncharacterized protein (UPF0335 family)
MQTAKNLEAIINKIERLYAEASVFCDELAPFIEEIRTDLYWAYKDAVSRGE